MAKHFQVDLASQSTQSIVSTTSKTLWGRKPSSQEKDDWRSAVKQGLAKTDLPLAMMQSTEGSDLNRLALLSAASRWSQAQWGSNASIEGSVGLGLSKNRSQFSSMNSMLFDQGVLKTMDYAEARFSELTDSWLQTFSGTHASDRGFF